MHRRRVVAAVVGALGLCACAARSADSPAPPASPADTSPKAAAEVGAPPTSAPEASPLAVASPAPEPESPAKPKRQRLYDETADVQQQIDAALVSARRENRRVLIVWGGDWCGWCHSLHGRFEHDAKLRKELLYEYDMVLADAGWDGKNVDLDRSYGADLNHGGYPFMTVLDATSGKPIAQQRTGSLVLRDKNGKASVTYGHDPDQLFNFFKAHEAPRLQASSVLQAGIDAAKSSRRLVLVHFGAPWCNPCHKLDRLLGREAITALLAKDYVDIKIDQDRMTGAKEIFERYKKDSAKAGIPWIAVLDPATGKAVADSDGPGGNVGYPETPEEIEHFMGMLKKTAKRLTAADLQQIQASLTK
jgi:thiol-disulfide isomerase/thioredoxin